MAKMLTPSQLKNIPFDKLTSKDVALAANEGDPIALKTFELAGDYLGAALADLVAITSPEAIFLFGGLANAGSLILDPTIESLNRNVMPIWKNKIKIILSSIDSENAPLLGAAALAIKEIEKKNTVVARRRVI